MTDVTVLECECISSKPFRITFDGGSSGAYVVEMCQACYDDDDKKFIVREVKV